MFLHPQLPDIPSLHRVCTPAQKIWLHPVLGVGGGILQAPLDFRGFMILVWMTQRENRSSVVTCKKGIVYVYCICLKLIQPPKWGELCYVLLSGDFTCAIRPGRLQGHFSEGSSCLLISLTRFFTVKLQHPGHCPMEVQAISIVFGNIASGCRCEKPGCL